MEKHKGGRQAVRLAAKPPEAPNPTTAPDELSTSLLRQLGEETGFMIWAATPNLERILFTSPAYEHIFGQSRERLYADARAFVESIHPDDREPLLGIPFNEPLHALVCRVVRPDKSMSWIRSWRIPIRDDAGVVRQLIGLSEDITESRRVLEDLEHRNRTLAALHEITRATLGSQSFDALVREIAAHVAAAVGFPIVVIERFDPVNGRVVLDGAAGLVSSADRPEPTVAGSLGASVAQQGEPLVLHAPWSRSDFETLYGTRVGTVVAAPQMSEGRAVGTLTIAHPEVVPVQPSLVAFVATLANHLAAVLERRRTEHALRASEQLFQDVAEHVHQAIMLIDINSFRVTYVSPGWARIFQRDPALLSDGVTKLLDWVHPDDRAILGDLLQLRRVRSGIAHQNDRDRRVEFRIVRPDGSIRWLRTQGNGIRNARGQVTHVLGLAEDVTEEKNRVAALETAVGHATARVRELERQQAELDRMAMAGRMAARIAHEINNPLASIKNAFFLVRSALPSTPERHAWADRIDREIDRIARIVRQMYELYRPEAGRGRADVGLTVVAAVDVFASEARERGVHISTELPSVRHTVSVPDSLLRELVAAVLQNAIEASPRDGTVHVAARVESDAVEVAVTDDGPGIPAALRDRVFEPFFTTKEPGVVVRGFGLTMVKSIVDALGGRVMVDAAAGGGAAVRVRIPAAEAPD
jgi:PAS domain S-box-containing protein